MADTKLTAQEIRSAVSENPKTRERDLAEKLGISEAQLVAVGAGRKVTRIDPTPDRLIPAVGALKEVMALTRNASCVHEKVGVYNNFHPGPHAAMLLNDDIDMRLFPAHWKYGFLVEKEMETGLRRSVQVFDAAGDAVHKVFLRDASDLCAWDRMRSELAIDDADEILDLAPRQPTEPARMREDKAETLRAEWDRLTDTHQFLRVVDRLKMNRLGAYRVAGAPYVRALDVSAVDAMLHAVRDTGIEFMFFVGNRGCIQIHNGPIHTLRAMGPWQNILDPGFDMHLRLDHVAEVWAVEKPTRRGPALSVEAFDAQGMLIFQAFPLAKENRDHRPKWREIVAGLPDLIAEIA